MEEINLITNNGYTLNAILLNEDKGIAYCQDRIVVVEYHKTGTVRRYFKEIKSIDILPLLEE